MKEEELKRFRDYANHYQGSDVFFLMEHIDEQAKQIATLKAALIQERANKLSSDGKAFHDYTIDADTQLAKEYPEINWDE